MSSIESDDFPEVKKQMDNSDNEEDPIKEVVCSIPGMKKYEVLDSEFIVPERFTIAEPIGNGAYGIVVAAIDSEKETKVDEEE